MDYGIVVIRNVRTFCAARTKNLEGMGLYRKERLSKKFELAILKSVFGITYESFSRSCNSTSQNLLCSLTGHSNANVVYFYLYEVLYT